MDDASSGKANPTRGNEEVSTASESGSAPTSIHGTTNATQPASTTYPSGLNRFPHHGLQQYASSSSMNMGNMAYALPGHRSPAPAFDQHHMHHYPPAQGMMYPVQSVGYPGQPPAVAVPYGVPYVPAYSPYPMPQPAGPGPVQHGTQYPPFAGPSVQNLSGPPSYGTGYYHPSYASYRSAGYPMGTQSRQQFPQGRGSSSTTPPKKDADKQAEAEYDVSKTIVDGSNPVKSGISNTDGTPSYTAPSSPNPPRGPPRKPKQSGHALWVGNLPPGANVIDLKEHFSQGAPDDIESVFLISKSNCAFVNYKSAPACSDALARFHDSRFQGVRLVCRLRKGFTAPGSGPMGSRLRSEEDDAVEEGTGVSESVTGDTRSVDRYFIVKSLTVEDLEMSKQSGIWATQSHNESNLNQAFGTTEHVYLIFSANKSGEYFGYARMLSPITDDETLTLEMPARPEPTPCIEEQLDVTPTPATSNARQGRIIDDSARGTIFWEVESLEDGVDDTRSERSDRSLDETEAEVEGGQTFGKPFRIQWMSTERVPFHRTRGLRNPWNANREVKIARDGTEIEPSIGRKVVQLFHLP